MHHGHAKPYHFMEAKNMRDFFYGWYLKSQSDTQTLAVIPALHQTGRKRTCSIQVITDDNAWTVTFPADEFHRVGKYISIGENIFGERGVRLSVNTPKLCIKGKLTFGPRSPLKYDIMGPFALVPFMECRHRVFSMGHLVNGRVLINGQKYIFRNAVGYWEGDRGRSFPKEYLWTQCCFPGGSLMLSVAEIPLGRIHFTGIIGVVLWHGKEYRLATYLGARVVQLEDGRVRIAQGDLELEAKLLEPAEKSLKAPTKGSMVRTIHESVSCQACYRFVKKGGTFFEFETDRASFEYEYHR